MKTPYIAITIISLLFLTILVNSNFVQAVPFTSLQDRYIMSDVALIGKITASREDSPTQTIYDVQVEQYLKNPLPEDKIRVIAQHTKNTQSPRAPPDLAFSVGDRAFFYLKEQFGNYNAMWFSYAVDSLCDPPPTYQDIQGLSQMINSTDRQWLHILHDDKEGPFRTGQNLTIRYTAWNTYLIPRTFEIAFNVTRVNDSSLVFHDNHAVMLKPCLGYQTVTTNFVPKKSGDYNVMVSFDRSLEGQIVQVRDNTGGCCIMEGSIPISSPLKQFKSGTVPKDIECWEGLDLVIKAEDGSPACVKPDTAQKLLKRGWSTGLENFALNSLIDNKNESNITKQKTITYLGHTVGEWKNMTPQQLNFYYEKYKDKFYTDLGKFLIKDEMRKELTRQKIVNVYDDFEVFPGMTLDSLPPHIGYDAVVNATDGNSYLLLGGVHANKIENVKITKLVFDRNVLDSINSGKKLPYANPFVKAPKVVISEDVENHPLVEPYSLTLDLDRNNSVTFYNNLTIPIRIQQIGSGLSVDDNRLGWKSSMVEPSQTTVIQFNKTGYYEWNARSSPKESENWWNYKGGGQIAAFSSSTSTQTSQEKIKMAGAFVEDSDIPWYSVGIGNSRDLEIGIYASVYHMIPDAQKYYTARAIQLIPFDVPIVIEAPTFAPDGAR